MKCPLQCLVLVIVACCLSNAAGRTRNSGEPHRLLLIERIPQGLVFRRDPEPSIPTSDYSTDTSDISLHTSDYSTDSSSSMEIKAPARRPEAGSGASTGQGGSKPQGQAQTHRGNDAGYNRQKSNYKGNDLGNTRQTSNYRGNDAGNDKGNIRQTSNSRSNNRNTELLKNRNRTTQTKASPSRPPKDETSTGPKFKSSYNEGLFRWIEGAKSKSNFSNEDIRWVEKNEFGAPRSLSERVKLIRLLQRREELKVGLSPEEVEEFNEESRKIDAENLRPHESSDISFRFNPYLVNTRSNMRRIEREAEISKRRNQAIYQREIAKVHERQSERVRGIIQKNAQENAQKNVKTLSPTIQGNQNSNKSPGGESPGSVGREGKVGTQAPTYPGIIYLYQESYKCRGRAGAICRAVEPVSSYRFCPQLVLSAFQSSDFLYNFRDISLTKG